MGEWWWRPLDIKERPFGLLLRQSILASPNRASSTATAAEESAALCQGPTGGADALPESASQREGKMALQAPIFRWGVGLATHKMVLVASRDAS